jgi:hypothetical protein
VTATIDPRLATTLTDARLQAHHAAQLATAMGISYLPRRSDDSHTNLEWLSAPGVLASRDVPGDPPFRIGVRIADLTLCMLSGGDRLLGTMPLHGRTIDEAASWIRERIADSGADAARFTLARHYAIPHHAVDDGAPFDASDAAAFVQLGAWFELGASTLGRVREASGSSEVRCWPHHVDIATLVTVAPDRTVGVGLEPGDVYYGEPYFYVNMHPQPPREALSAPLAGGGCWHTHEWLGAVLPGSRIAAPETLREQVDSFLDSAIAECRTLVERDAQTAGATSP